MIYKNKFNLNAARPHGVNLYKTPRLGNRKTFVFLFRSLYVAYKFGQKWENNEIWHECSRCSEMSPRGEIPFKHNEGIPYWW